MIYFIRDDASQAIKIGVAEDPMKRLGMLQIGNPNPLRLLGCVPGCGREEARLHERLAEHRLRGEWFRTTPELVAAVDKIIAEYGIYSRAPGEGDNMYARWWSQVKRFDEAEWDEMQERIRARIFKATGYLISVCWGNEPSMTGTKDRVHSFQIFADVQHETHPFWLWHVANTPQWFASPGHASDAWTASHKYWSAFVCPEGQPVRPTAIINAD